MGTKHWVARLIGVGFGVAYFARQFVGISEEDLSEMCSFVMLSTFTGGTVLLVIRRWVAQLQQANREAALANNQAIQFTIRDLLLFIFAIACLLTIGRWLLPRYPRVDEPALVAVFSICCVTVALSSVWSMLGVPHPFLRSTLVLLIALGAGTFVTFVLAGGGNGVWWCSLMVSDWLFLLGSLLVVRLCGYRLVRLSRSEKSVGRENKDDVVALPATLAE